VFEQVLCAVEVLAVQRIVVVDDQASQRDGRVAWLAAIPGTDVTGMTFEQAAALGADWSAVSIAVLDGHDRRPPARRAQAARDAGIPDLAPHDNFLGVRIAELIRRHSTAETTRIILVSAYARDNDLRARRIAQAGVDYVFEHYEVDASAETFTRAVLYPETFSPPRRPARGPDVAGAIAAVESSPAGPMLLGDEPHSHHRELEWSLRQLRQRLHALLPGGPTTDTGPRNARGARKSWLAAQLRQALGKDLPVDPG
jgi:CheY-like chemotaxis protein